jgi:hypothetical protein
LAGGIAGMDGSSYRSLLAGAMVAPLKAAFLGHFNCGPINVLFLSLFFWFQFDFKKCLNAKKVHIWKKLN